ncbi:RNA exonuclease 1 homolog [Dreissena polymorpha]|uniref:RNA exonuclease 1 homolog n=1 Tax=Dreissena polymorpha TaxID=45954 RepID=UPI0022647F94|nr:RNA exonuclease 1 homolog [Dreissena polymorpha]
MFVQIGRNDEFIKFDYPRPDPGGEEGKNHVHKANVYDVDGYKTTQELKPPPAENNYGVELKPPPAENNYGVYAIDTESVHTKKGLEVCKVTVIDINCKVVYDEYCLPTSDIIDYNTYWSGIKKENLHDVTKTFAELRDDLLAIFNRDTILVGHGLNHDLMVLKILHTKIIDTVMLYSHPLGLPRRRSLKDIASSELQREIQVGDIYRKCLSKVLSEAQLRDLDYARPDPERELGRVCLYGDHHGFKQGYCRNCCRPFDTSFANRSPCDFHLERSRKMRGVQMPYGCCGRSFGSKGCQAVSTHVHKENLYLDTNGFKVTPQLKTPHDGSYGVYALDTESVHTTKGIEVCKVTVLDTNCRVVYDQFCLPTNEIVDYNTIFSGIRKEDLNGVTKTFEDVRNDLLELFNRDTILVGHSLFNDLNLLKIVHSNVIDTAVLYPHPRGLPLKRSLKDIALTELNRNIQSGGGHDSKEDAEVTMKLLLRKL